MVWIRDHFLWIFIPAALVMTFSATINKPVFVVAGVALLIATFSHVSNPYEEWRSTRFLGLIPISLLLGLLLLVIFFQDGWGWSGGAKIMF